MCAYGITSFCSDFLWSVFSLIYLISSQYLTTLLFLLCLIHIELLFDFEEHIHIKVNIFIVSNSIIVNNLKMCIKRPYLFIKQTRRNKSAQCLAHDDFPYFNYLFGYRLMFVRVQNKMKSKYIHFVLQERSVIRYVNGYGNENCINFSGGIR